MQAVMNVVSIPPIIARKLSFARSLRRPGAMLLMPPN